MRQVQEALAGVGVPVFAGVWRPTTSAQNPPPQYLVYSTTTTEDAHQDDGVVSYKTFVYLNLWSDGDPTDRAAHVREAMYAAGFAMVEETDKGYTEPAYDSATRQFTVQWTWRLREEAMLGFFRMRAWDAGREHAAREPKSRYIDEVWPALRPT